MKKTVCFAIGISLCFALFTPIAMSQQKTFTIGVEAQKYYPQFDNEGGKEYFGFAKDLLDMFANYKGYKFEYKIRPIKRLFSEFVEKKAFDFKYPDNPVWQSDMKKDKKVVYSDSVVKYIDGVIVLVENKSKQLSEFKTLGTVRGFTPYPYLDLIQKQQVNLSENNNFISLMKQILKKRIDGAYSNISVARYNIKEILRIPDALVFNPNLPHIKDSYYLSSIKQPQVIQEFNQFLKDKKTQIDQMKKQYNLGLLDD
ncbi:Extracellular solute-binding protein, family 3 [Candidatus Magnetomorum sp. HK-1]|nr:Extracellular solute-binding protein, family 3 [Candidatus Magnetomorum sp. HK-1]